MDVRLWKLNVGQAVDGDFDLMVLVGGAKECNDVLKSEFST
jgi:hypothetical protein